MAQRDFRQLGLADSTVRRRGKKSEWLDRLDAALDWPALEAIVAGIYASREGGLAYPLLTYVKLLLLQQWYGLSDEGLRRRSTTGCPSAGSPASRSRRACRITPLGHQRHDRAHAVLAGAGEHVLGHHATHARAQHCAGSSIARWSCPRHSPSCAPRRGAAASWRSVAMPLRGVARPLMLFGLEEQAGERPTAVE